MRVASQRFLLAGLVGLILAPVAAFGGSSVRLYDANATYLCLRKLPEYRPSSYSWYPGKPGPAPPRNAFYVFAPRPGLRYKGNWPVRGAGVGPSWMIPVEPINFVDFMTLRIFVFDKSASAQATYRIVIGETPRSTRAIERKSTALIRNAYLEWRQPPPKTVRALFLGCLRTR